MLSLRKISRLLLLILLTALPLSSSAAGLFGTVDDTKLIRLYTFSDANPTVASYQRQIADERGKIRVAIDDELNNFINASLSSTGSSTLALSAYERERTLVAILEARLEEAKVDSDLLRGEGQYYAGQNSSGTGSGSANEVRLTDSYPDFQAKTATVEERIASIQFFLDMHRERLQKFSFQQQLDQFSVYIIIGEYLGIVLGIILLERFLRTRLFRGIQNRSRRYAAMKIFTTVVYIVLIVWVISRLSAQYPGILTSFAIIGAGIAVALQDVLKDLVGWFMIIQKRMFSLGHRVTIGAVTGDVIDISLFRTTLLEVPSGTSDNVTRMWKTLYIPNSLVLREFVLNYNTTSDFLEGQISLTVGIESDWKRAEVILQQILEEETGQFAKKAQRQSASRTQHFFVSRESAGGRIFVDLGEKGVQFTLRFPVPIGELRSVTSAINRKILERFKEENPPIDLMFSPTRAVAEKLKIEN